MRSKKGDFHTEICNSHSPLNFLEIIAGVFTRWCAATLLQLLNKF